MPNPGKKAVYFSVSARAGASNSDLPEVIFAHTESSAFTSRIQPLGAVPEAPAV